jgi:hypothetical protein|tara:strand:+ start:740 stop:841 length:102 start_codon:yes stop_codon:yes gene_type:complete
MIDRIAFAIFGFFDKLGELIDKLFIEKKRKKKK